MQALDRLKRQLLPKVAFLNQVYLAYCSITIPYLFNINPKFFQLLFLQKGFFVFFNGRGERFGILFGGN
jgi:hypothetical protein